MNKLTKMLNNLIEHILYISCFLHDLSPVTGDCLSITDGLLLPPDPWLASGNLTSQRAGERTLETGGSKQDFGLSEQLTH